MRPARRVLFAGLGLLLIVLAVIFGLGSLWPLPREPWRPTVSPSPLARLSSTSIWR